MDLPYSALNDKKAKRNTQDAQQQFGWRGALYCLGLLSVGLMLLKQQQALLPRQQIPNKPMGPLLLDHPHITDVATPQTDCAELLPEGVIQDVLYYREPGAENFLVLDNQTYNMLHASVTHGERVAANGTTIYSHVRSDVHNALRHFFSRGCGPAHNPSLVVDVGGNVGYFTLLAATYGCQVLTFDPQAVCNEVERHNLCLNRHNYPAIANNWVQLINRPVSDVPATINMSVPRSCNGAFSVAAASTGDKATAFRQFISRDTISIDSLLLPTPLDIYLLKIDAEGFEHHVLNSLRGMIAQRRIRHIFVELTPAFMRRDKQPREVVFEPFAELLAQDCVIYPLAGLDIANLGMAETVFRDEASFWPFFQTFEKQTDFFIQCPEH